MMCLAGRAVFVLVMATSILPQTAPKLEIVSPKEDAYLSGPVTLEARLVAPPQRTSTE